MKVAVIGGNGQLGMDLIAAFSGIETVSLTHEQIEIGDLDAVMNALKPLHATHVINTAARHKVDECEKNPELTFRTNALGSLNLAKASEALGFDLVHISTDYVFDGAKRKPYVETDCPHPLNVYATTKVAGEHFIAAHASRFYIVRSSGLYGHHQCRAKGRNFIETMFYLAKERPEVRVVEDEILTPTYTLDLALQIRELVKTGAYGLYHATNNGECSWYEFAKAIFEFAGLSTPLKPTTVKEFPSPVKRPTYSVLENAALQSLGIDRMPEWRESLERYFRSRLKSVE